MWLKSSFSSLRPPPLPPYRRAFFLSVADEHDLISAPQKKATHPERPREVTSFRRAR